MLTSIFLDHHCLCDESLKTYGIFDASEGTDVGVVAANRTSKMDSGK